MFCCIVTNTLDGDEHWTNDIEGICFGKTHLVCLFEEQGDIERRFSTEEEAVNFIKTTNNIVCDELKTIEDLEEDILHPGKCIPWEYYHSIIDCKCTTLTKGIIQCLLNAIK